MSKTTLRSLLSLLLVALMAPFMASAQANHLVMSQIYTAGGNTGALYNADFVEIYNPTASAITMTNWTIQYASATGTSWSIQATLNATVAAGGYYLVEAPAGSGGVANPATADTTASALAMGAAAGKVLLANTNTAQSGCPTASAAVVDLIGYGTTATCYEGTGPAPVPTTLLSDTRVLPGQDTNQNATDFVAITPVPHNSTFGVGVSGISGTGAASVNPDTTGSATLLTVTVKPAASPTSTGIAVSANLSAYGGLATQAFYDDGVTGGDVTAGDNIFSYNLTPSVIVSGGTITANITDAQSRSATATIGLTTVAPVAYTPIHTIQGKRLTTPVALATAQSMCTVPAGAKAVTAQCVSPYSGQTVMTSGIVTSITSAGYYLQTPDSSIDADPSTPEALYVYTGSGKVPTTIKVGYTVQVTGAISIYPAATASQTPATELAPSAQVVLSSSVATLPAPIQLTTAQLTPSGGLWQLTPYESMRVTFASLMAISGTGGSDTANEATLQPTSNYQFYATITGTPRPFREPGVDIRDTLPATGVPSNLLLFDDNPERILVDTTLNVARGTAGDMEVTQGAVLTNPTGILDFTYSNDSYYDPTRFVLDASVTSFTPGITPQPVAPKLSSEFTVAAYNIERFFDTNAANNIDFYPVTGKTETSSAVNFTPAAYAIRLKKVSLAIRTILNSPDVVMLEEAENQGVIQDIANQIAADGGPTYTAYGTGTSYAPYTNDVGGISVGFLVKTSTVDAIKVEQFGNTQTFVDPRYTDGTVQTLNDRPPLVLHAGVKRGGAADYPITVIVNHMLSLTSENDLTKGIYTRVKKELQTEFITNLIQGYQANGEHVISGGDFNAFEFSDGYIDILATATGNVGVPANQVFTPAASPTILKPAATDLVTLLAPALRQSYNEDGNAQVLDHIVATSNLVNPHIAYAHLDADFPSLLHSDPTTPARTSDHDAAVGYFTLPAPVLSAAVTPTTAASFGVVAKGSSSAGQVFTLNNTGEGAISVTVATTGDFAASNTCGTSLTFGANCSINVVFTPTAAGNRTGTLTITTSASTTTIALAGQSPDFTLTDSSNATTGTLSVTGTATTTDVLTVTSIGGFAGSVAATCTPTTTTVPTGGYAPSCVIAASPVSVSATATTATISVLLTTVSHTNSAKIAPAGSAMMGSLLHTKLGLLFAAITALMLVLAGRTRRFTKAAGLLVLLVMAGMATGCGDKTNINPNGTAPGTYTYTVTATSGTLTHSYTVNVKVN